MNDPITGLAVDLFILRAKVRDAFQSDSLTLAEFHLASLAVIRLSRSLKKAKQILADAELVAEKERIWSLMFPETDKL